MKPEITTPRAPTPADVLVETLGGLRHVLERCQLALALPGGDGARRERRELLDQIDDYIVPRLEALGAPLLAVVGGSTGAGKSTLLNSLLGVDVTSAGVLRPTTRSPVLVFHPDDAAWFEGQRVLPGLVRVSSPGAASTDTIRLVATTRASPGLALLDAPDIDSVVGENRLLAAQLLAAADLWLFVTTAARYADAVPWDQLERAQQRGTALAMVLNRVPAEATDEVTAHLVDMLRQGGLGRAPVFTIAETQLEHGRLAEADVYGLRSWLDELAGDAASRAEVVRATLDGALASLAARVDAVVSHVEAERAFADSLRRATDERYAAAATEVGEAVADGALLRREVLGRWQELVGSGQLLKGLESRVGLLRDRLRRAWTGEPAPVEEVALALEHGIEALVAAAADTAAERTVEAWAATPGGRELMGGERRRLDRSSPDLRQVIGDEVREWQRAVLELVAEQSGSKRTTARALSFGVNGAGVALMILVFAQTGGLTGIELAVAGGTATVSQKVLEALFGDQAVRQLTARARDDLLARVGRVLAAERARFDDVLASVAPAGDVPGELRRAAAAVATAAPQALPGRR